MQIKELSSLCDGSFRVKYNYALKNFNNIPIEKSESFESIKGVRLWNRIMYISSGIAIINRYEDTIVAPPGSILFFPSDCEFTLTWKKHSDFSFANSFIIAFSLYNEDGSEISFGSSPFLIESTNEAVKNVFDKSVDCYAIADGCSILRCISYLYELFSIIIAGDNQPSRQKENISSAIIYINENYATNIEISTLTKLCHVSESTLRRAFICETGLSPIKYINKIRMAKAYDMILSGYSSISKIAAEVNIPDISYFSKMFKKTYGISPTSIKSRRI